MQSGSWRWLALGVVLIACADKAEPEYTKCQAAEAKGDLLAASFACEAAVTADPTSVAGKAAAQKLKDIDNAREKAKADAKVEAAAKKAAQDAEDAKCSSWGTICTLGRFRDGSERTTGGQTYKTKAECDGAGARLGIKCDPCRCND
jgi:hypothetical protein